MLPPLPLVVDSTMMNSWRQCQRSFYHEYVCKRSPSETSPDLHAGGAVARALEVIRKAVYDDGVELQRAMERGFLAFCQFWGTYTPPDKKVRGEMQPHPKTFVNTWSLIEDYFQTYPPSMDIIRPYRGHPDVSPFEYTFAIPIPEAIHPSGDPFIYAGRFDMIAEFGSPDAIYIVDEKTTGSWMGPGWGDKWTIRGQFIGYTWALRQLGIPCRGAVVRGMQFLQTKFNHAQTVHEYPDWLIDRWYNQLVLDLNAMSAAHANNYWNYNFGEACDTTFGGCSFRVLCTAEDERLWYGDFAERVWDPLDRDPTHTREIKQQEEVEFSLADLINEVGVR